MKPKITLSVASPVIRQGNPVHISGTASGNPTPGIAIWIFGPDGYERTVVQPDPDGTFSLDLDGAATTSLQPADYYVVAQHPMPSSDDFEMVVTDDYVVTYFLPRGPNQIPPYKQNFQISGPGCLTGKDAADALAAGDANTDDEFARATFRITAIPTSAPEFPDPLVIGGAVVIGIGLMIGYCRKD